MNVFEVFYKMLESSSCGEQVNFYLRDIIQLFAVNEVVDNLLWNFIFYFKRGDYEKAFVFLDDFLVKRKSQYEHEFDRLVYVQNRLAQLVAKCPSCKENIWNGSFKTCGKQNENDPDSYIFICDNCGEEVVFHNRYHKIYGRKL